MQWTKTIKHNSDMKIRVPLCKFKTCVNISIFASSFFSFFF